MEVRIVTSTPKTLVGKRLTMSLSNDRTVELWQNFMPFRKAIKNKTTTDLISLQNYKTPFRYQEFKATSVFEKWAAIEVSKVLDIPENMEIYHLSAGLYAVFVHKGTAASFHNTLAHIYNDWLPNSSYTLDNRPHFEVLGERYKNNDPFSEEEVWIPIKDK
ncbi:MAG: AraC family transcriptional regulator [Psychroserpens sp.]|jgi:AraC family transcriptional regulator